MSSNTIYFTSGYPVVTNNPIAEFLLFQPANTVIYPKNVNSKVSPCQPNVNSFNTVNFIRELPPCQPSLKQLQQSQYPIYSSVNSI